MFKVYFANCLVCLDTSTLIMKLWTILWTLLQKIDWVCFNFYCILLTTSLSMSVFCWLVSRAGLCVDYCDDFLVIAEVVALLFTLVWHQPSNSILEVFQYRMSTLWLLFYYYSNNRHYSEDDLPERPPPPLDKDNLLFSGKYCRSPIKRLSSLINGGMIISSQKY